MMRIDRLRWFNEETQKWEDVTIMPQNIDAALRDLSKFDNAYLILKSGFDEIWVGKNGTWNHIVCTGPRKNNDPIELAAHCHKHMRETGKTAGEMAAMLNVSMIYMQRLLREHPYDESLEPNGPANRPGAEPVSL